MKCYRAAVIARSSGHPSVPYRSVPYPTRELAAAALPRLLLSQFWQERLAREQITSWEVRIDEEDGPSDACGFVAGLDLTSFSEGLRRRLYDQVAADHFSPRPGSSRTLAERWPPYSANEARLSVIYLEGRWLATWKKLELEQGSEEDRSEVLRIHGVDDGITYYEV